MDTETTLSSCPASSVADSTRSLQAIVEEDFPGLWPAVEVGLSVGASLLLKDNANPVAVIYMGGPGTSKTTVASMFADHPQCYRSDNFTPAAFVTQAANQTRASLTDIDLLPRIKHKLLVTPELAPIFRGKEDELAKRFATLTRVLDGEGLTTDPGHRGSAAIRATISLPGSAARRRSTRRSGA